VEDVGDRALLHHASEVHDDDVVRHLRNHAEVVVMNTIAVSCRAEGAEEIQDLRLRRPSIAVVGSSAIRSRGRHDKASRSWRAGAGLPRAATIGVDRSSGSAMPTLRKRSTVIRRVRSGDRGPAAPLALVQPERLDDLIADRDDGANAAIGSCGIRASSAPRIARISAPLGESRVKSTAGADSFWKRI